MADGIDETLSAGERAVLIDGLSDDVSVSWTLIHLGIRANPPSSDEPPDTDAIAAAFESFDRLLARDLVRLGRIEYIDPQQPASTAGPVRHVAEPIHVVREGVEQECRDAKSWSDWAFCCWVVNTDAGDDLARLSVERGA